ncbi:hypothetical protein GGR03_002270 [Aurantimonas endophytica]|uniref:Uncharacterized protein n=1 Tax=Aurantimonas endophytica TaxID=1522175 RepID=A0A7W6HDF7_9HYPH|nr:hypothetical protein [Aurantimonas endophytica]
MITRDTLAGLEAGVITDAEALEQTGAQHVDEVYEQSGEPPQATDQSGAELLAQKLVDDWVPLNWIRSGGSHGAILFRHRR